MSEKQADFFSSFWDYDEGDNEDSFHQLKGFKLFPDNDNNVYLAFSTANNEIS